MNVSKRLKSPLIIGAFCSNMFLETNEIAKLITKIFQHSLQIVYESIPVIPEVIDLYREKGLISGVSIPKYTLGYNGRIVLVLLKVSFVYELYTHYDKIIECTKYDLSKLFATTSNIMNDPHLFFILSYQPVAWCIYIFMVKAGDTYQMTKNISPVIIHPKDPHIHLSYHLRSTYGLHFSPLGEQKHSI